MQRQPEEKADPSSSRTGTFATAAAVLLMAYVASPPFLMMGLKFLGPSHPPPKILIILYEPLQLVYEHVPPYKAYIDWAQSKIQP
jgi:hypothetical protein